MTKLKGLMEKKQDDRHTRSAMLTKKALSVSVASIMLATPAYALESISDAGLRGVSGQDGTVITASMDSATIDKLTWQDGAQGSLALSGITINPVGTDTQITNTVSIQTGSTTTSGNPGVGIDLALGRADIQVPNLSICAADGSGCSKLGALAITNKGTQTQLSLVTENGLFNKEGSAQLKMMLDEASVALEQENGTTSAKNQLILGNMFANITADGKLFVEDAKGLRFIGKVNFKPTGFNGNSRQGFEVLVQHGIKASNGAVTKVSLGKVALSGELKGVDVMLRGVSGTKTFTQDTQAYNDVVNGTAGVHLRASANIDENFKVQLGGGDTLSPSATAPNDGLRLTGWHSFGDQTTENGLVKSFDTGDVYVNIFDGKTVVEQNLQRNERLTLSQSQFSTIKTNTDYLSRKFVKEAGDTGLQAFETASGKRYVANYGGFVLGTDGQTVKAFDGLTKDYNQGIVNKDGQYLSARNFLKDGLVTDPNQSSYTINSNGSGGRFLDIHTVDKNTGEIAKYILPLIKDRSFIAGQTYGNSLYNRENRQVRVWVEPPSAGLPNNIVVAPYGYAGLYGSNSYHKAIHLGDTSLPNPNKYRYLSTSTSDSDNLNNIDGAYPFTVNNNGEVRNRSGVLVLRNHAFNEKGFLVENSRTEGNVNDKQTGATTGNGEYVYEYTYNIDETTDELVLTPKNGSAATEKRFKLLVLTKEMLDKATDDNYTISTATKDANDKIVDKNRIVINARDLYVQAVPMKTEFFQQTAATTEKTDSQDFGVGVVLYDADTNMLLFPETLAAADTMTGYTNTGEAWGYKLNLTTKGSNGGTDFAQEGATQTSGMLLTHKADDGTNRYIGMRHLDSVLKAEGDIQFASDGIVLTAKDFVFAFRGEIATGALPDATKKFGNYDRLLVAEGRLKGDLYAKIVRDNGTIGFSSSDGLGFQADLKLARGVYGTNSGVRLITPDGKGSVSMSEITGTARIKGAVDTVDLDDTADGFKGALRIKSEATLNPTTSVSEDVRIRHIGLNAKPIAGNLGSFDMFQDAKLGEVAFSKNTIYSEVTIGQ